jgi:hypothetical protein
MLCTIPSKLHAITLHFTVFYTFTLIPFFTEVIEYVEIEEEFDYKSGIQ